MNTESNPLTAIPADLDSAVSQLMSILEESLQLESFKGKSMEDCAGIYHHSLGMAIRNAWGLWDSETPISKHLEFLGIIHGDDKSAAIFRALWHHVNGTPFDIPGYVEMCRAHWAEYGLDMLGAPQEKKGPPMSGPITEVFVLLEDGDQTTRSIPEPFGVAVTTEAEAKRHVEEGRNLSVYGYQRLRVYADYDEACRSVYGKLHDECKARRLSKP